LLHNANLVENYPGFPGGISGPELVKLFIDQSHNLNIDVTLEEVTELDYQPGVFQVKTRHNSYLARIVVVATGTRALGLDFLSIPEDIKGRVYYEVYDLLELEGKCMLVIGSGDAAFDYALNLGRKNQVIILNRGENPKCLPLLWERAQKVSTITYRNKTTVCGLRKDGEQGLFVDCQSETGALQFQADYVIGAVGREGQLDCLSGSVRQQEMDLHRQGVLYLVGDIKNGIYRQTSIAVGDGVMAAMKIYRHLKEIA
jgi:thioredoxin reductase